jgi:probable F420-dependent oxidoreductase
MGVQVGLGLFTGQVPPGSGISFAEEYRTILELSREAEVLGFDSIWVSEHHGSSDGYLPSLLPMLAAIAAVTERVKLGTGVMLAPMHNPLRLAEDAAVVDNISDGRLILGLARGWREEEFRMFGVPEGERLARTLEPVEILRRAWTGERFSFQGKAYSYQDVKVTPTPARPGGPPIYLGGFEEKTVRRSGKLADGYIRSRSDLEASKEAVRWAEEGAREAGRDPDALGFALLQNAFVARDGEDAWAKVRDGVNHQIGVYAAWRAGADTPENPALTVPDVGDETLKSLTIHGTPAEVLSELEPIANAFAGREEFHLIVRLHYPGMDHETAREAVELFGTEVLPALKGE